MANLLLQWLNQDVGLAPQVTSFEDDFANGYLFGRILYLYNQNSVFDKFVNKQASNAKINNFSLLDPIFRSMRIRFDSKIAFEIITRVPQAAMNVIRDLKTTLELMASRPTAIVGRPRENGQLALSNMPLRLSRPKFDRAQHELFVKSIKMYIRGQNQVDMAHHLRKFTQHQVDLEESARQGEIDDLRQFFAEKEQIRQQRRLNLQREHEFLHDWQEKGIEEWAYNQQIKREREEHARRHAAREEARKAEAREAILSESRARVQEDLPQFENTLRRVLAAEAAEAERARMAGEPQSSNNDVRIEAATHDAAPIQPDGSISDEYKVDPGATLSRREFLRHTQKIAGHPEDWKEEGDRHMATIRKRSRRRDTARLQRERRRRKFLSDSQADREDRGAQRDELFLSEKLLKEPQRERLMIDALTTISRHTPMFKANRANREEQYRIQREQDAEDALQRDNNFFYLTRMEYNTEVLQQHGRYDEYKLAAQAASHHRNKEACFDIVHQIVTLSLAIAARRRLREASIETEVLQEMRAMFTSGDLSGLESGQAAPVRFDPIDRKTSPSSALTQQAHAIRAFWDTLPDTEEGKSAVPTTAIAQAIASDAPAAANLPQLTGLADQISADGFADGKLTMEELLSLCYVAAAFEMASTEHGGTAEESPVSVARMFVAHPEVLPPVLLTHPVLLASLQYIGAEAPAEGGEAKDAQAANNENDDEGDVATRPMPLVGMLAHFIDSGRADSFQLDLTGWAIEQDLSAASPGSGHSSQLELQRYLCNDGYWGHMASEAESKSEEKEPSKEVVTAAAEDASETGVQVDGPSSSAESSEESLPASQVLGCVVETMKHSVFGPPKQPPRPNVPQLELTVCLTGKPFTGKSTQARRLADKYNLSLIDVKALVDEAFIWADGAKAEVMQMDGTKRFVDDRQYHEKVANIGMQMKEALMRGESVADDLVIQLIIERIFLIDAEAKAIRAAAVDDTRMDSFGQDFASSRERRMSLLRELFNAWDGDNSGEVDVGEMVDAVRGFGEGLSDETSLEEAMEIVRQMDADQDGSITWEEFFNYFMQLFEPHGDAVFDEVITKLLATTRAQPPRGWILDGFPHTSAQAQLLEQALTGFVKTEPRRSAAPHSELDQWSGLVAEAPPMPPTDPEAMYGKSGINLAIDISVPNDLVLRRALGRRVDPITGAVYHLENNPPPMDLPIKARLQEPSGISSWRASLAAELSARDSDAEAFESWFEMFNNRARISPFLPMGGAAFGEDALFESLCKPIDGLLAERDRVKADEKAVIARSMRRKQIEKLFNKLSGTDAVTPASETEDPVPDSEAKVAASPSTMPAALTHADLSILLSNVVASSELALAELGVAEKSAPETVTDITGKFCAQVRLTAKQIRTFHTSLGAAFAAATISTNPSHDEMTSTDFVATLEGLCGETIKGPLFGALYVKLENGADDYRKSRNYKLKQLFKKWQTGPVALDHVSCTVTEGAVQAMLLEYNEQARERYSEKISELQEQARAVIVAEAEEKGEPAPEVADEDLQFEAPRIAYVFDLGDEPKEDDKGKKGKKGKAKKGGPQIDETGDEIAPEQFVDVVLEHVAAAQERSTYDDSCETEFGMMLQLMDATVAVRIQAAEDSAPPPPEPPAPEPRHVPDPPEPNPSRPISKDHSDILLNLWYETVGAYTVSMRSSMEALSQLRGQRVGHFAQVRTSVHRYLERPGQYRALLTTLQARINSVTQDMRFHEAVKAELHERVAEARNAYLKSIEEKEAAAATDLGMLENDKFIASHVEMAVREYVTMMQSEVDRFHASRNILVDYLVASQGTVKAPSLALPAEESSEAPAIMAPVLAPLLFGLPRGTPLWHQEGPWV